MLSGKGVTFQSETDTEVACNLIADCYRENGGDFLKAVQQARSQLEGSYALVVLCGDHPDTIIAMKKDSPLIFGKGTGCNFVASDVPAILKYTREVVYLSDGEMVVMDRDSYRILDAAGTVLEKPIEHIQWEISAAEKDGYDHFMLKEIYEQPSAIAKTISPRDPGWPDCAGRRDPGCRIPEDPQADLCGGLRQRILCGLPGQIHYGKVVPGTGGAYAGIGVPVLRSPV